MAEASDRVKWNRTFAVLAQMFNANRDPDKTRPIDPLKFFPWKDKEPAVLPPPTDAQRVKFRKLYGKGKPNP